MVLLLVALAALLGRDASQGALNVHAAAGPREEATLVANDLATHYDCISREKIRE